MNAYDYRLCCEARVRVTLDETHGYGHCCLDRVERNFVRATIARDLDFVRDPADWPDYALDDISRATARHCAQVVHAYRQGDRHAFHHAKRERA